jgi:hypothetical protein
MINGRHTCMALLFALTALVPRDSDAAVPVNVVLESVNNYNPNTNCTQSNSCAGCCTNPAVDLTPEVDPPITV